MSEVAMIAVGDANTRPQAAASGPAPSLRIAIDQLVHEQPGLPIAALARALGVSHSAASYHVEHLAQCGNFVVQPWGNTRGIFPNIAIFATHDVRAMVMLSRDPMATLFLDLIEIGGMRTNPALMRALGVSFPTVAFHVRKLSRMGLVDSILEGRSRRYIVNKSRQQDFIQTTRTTLGIA